MKPTLFFLLLLFPLKVCAMEQSEAASGADFDFSCLAFPSGAPIPDRFTCEGPGFSPPFRIGKVPPGTQSLALVMENPDSRDGIMIHWIVWNIPATAAFIQEGRLPTGAVEGRNSWTQQGYRVPCLPSGSHRYLFKLFALDTVLKAPQDATYSQVEKMMKGHVLGQACIIGVNTRR